MTVTYTLCDKGGSKFGEIVMKKSSFSGGNPVVSQVRRSEVGGIAISQVIIANMCTKDARGLLKFVGQVWTGIKVYTNNDSGEIRVCIPSVESPKKQDRQKDKSFDRMIKDIGRQNDMFNVIASAEAYLCGDTTCNKCAFYDQLGGIQNRCLALKYTNYKEEVNQAFDEVTK